MFRNYQQTLLLLSSRPLIHRNAVREAIHTDAQDQHTDAVDLSFEKSIVTMRLKEDLEME